MANKAVPKWKRYREIKKRVNAHVYIHPPGARCKMPIAGLCIIDLSGPTTDRQRPDMFCRLSAPSVAELHIRQWPAVKCP